MTSDEAVEVVEDISELPANARKYALGLLLVAVGSATMGGVLGWLICEKKLKQRYEEQASIEIEEAREHYKTRYKGDEYATPQSAAEIRGASTDSGLDKAARALVNYQGGAAEDLSRESEDSSEGDGDSVEVTIEAETVNIFENAETTEPGTHLTQAEVDARTSTAPYIIAYDEFMGSDFQQKQLTYFEGDDVLMDDTDDQPIPDVQRVVGRENLRFGHASGDESVVFIRNDRMSMDFEVSRNLGLYSHEVAGFRHSDDYERRGEKRPIRKFRGGDE